MKKGAAVIVVLALLLCALVVVVGGGVYYFLLRNTPAKAFKDSLKKFNEGDYVQFDSDGDISVEVKVPDYPEFNIEMDMEMTGEGKVDIQNNKMYQKTVTKMDEESQTTEVYIIGDVLYIREGSGDFTKVTGEDAKKVPFQRCELACYPTRQF